METGSNTPRNNMKECAHYIRLRDQRRAEIGIGRELHLGSEYQEMGCHECNGENSECRNYIE